MFDTLTIGTIIVSIVIPLVGFIMKALMTRIDVLETKIQEKISDSEARQMFNDKLSPIVEDIQEIKQQLDRLVDYLIKKR